MNKTAAIYDVTKKTGIPFAKTERVVNTFLETIAQSLANGERVTITGFGTFEVRKMKATTKKIPRTERRIHVPEHLRPAFIAGVGLKKIIQGR